jgi:2-oxoglutarate dehydrogenase E2 component (dihydrolipoamide succinyltransferase)
VERDETLLEISTDKVDAEIPSPVEGILAEITVAEGETVEVGTIVGYIETEKGAAVAAAPAPKAAEPAPAPAAAPAAPAAPVAAAAPGSVEERLRQRSTPLVRRIAAEHNIDLAQVQGTGQAGRVTKQDIMAFIEGGKVAAPAPAAAPKAAPAAPARPAAPAAAPAAGGAISSDQLWKLFYSQAQHPEFPAREGDDVEPMDRIRRITAQHMVIAKRVAPHVHSFIEIDFTRIDRIRRQNRARWEEQGARVSFTAFVAWAVARTLQDYPMINATVSGDDIIYRGDINLGMAVDLNPGLIVPVIKNADDLNLTGISRRIIDLASRARDRKLQPDEIQGGTFSITNPGVLGTLAGTPIIPVGTAAILGTGAIEKKPVVVEVDGMDTIAIRLRSIFSLGYDHRLVDGADAARFLAQLKAFIENFPEDAA